MYHLKSAIAKHKTPGSPWLRVDVSDLTLADIYSAFEEVYLEVGNTYWTESRVILASAILPRVRNMADTISGFFTDVGSETLPTIAGRATITQGEVVFADAYYAGYDCQRGAYDRSPTYTPDPSESDCLILRKDGVDPDDFAKHCLVSINGLFHRVDTDGVVNYVIDAFNSVRIARRHEVGIYNFKNVGSLTCLSITADMVHRRNPDQPLCNQLYIKSPVSTEGKTVALVMGGYLHLIDNYSFSPVGNDIYCLETQGLPLIDRFFESEKLIDLSSFELERRGSNLMQLSREQLLSDDVLTRWMTLSQSFLVLIDNDTVNVERTQVETGSSWGMYVTPKEPTEPLVSNFGAMLTYSKCIDDGRWTLHVGNNLVNNLLIHTAEAFNSPNPADNRVPHNREGISLAHFLRIYTDKIVVE